MSYLEQAKRNKANAEKARAFEEMQAKQQAQQVYSTGQADAISAVERRLQQKAAEARTGEFVDDWNDDDSEAIYAASCYEAHIEFNEEE